MHGIDKRYNQFLDFAKKPAGIVIAIALNLYISLGSIVSTMVSNMVFQSMIMNIFCLIKALTFFNNVL